MKHNLKQWSEFSALQVFILCCRVPAPKRLKSQEEEGNTLPITVFSNPSYLSLAGKV